MTKDASQRPSAGPYLALLGFAALPPVVFGLLGAVLSHKAPKERCPGFVPCLSMSDRAYVLAVLLIPVMFLWAVGGLAALTWLRRRPAYRFRPAIVQGLVPVIPGYFLVLFIALLV
jgi:hypothetical protein